MDKAEDIWDNIKDFFNDMQIPDIGGVDGGTIQLILVIVVGLWLFMKLKRLFFLFMFITAFYYIMQAQGGGSPY